MKSKNTGLDEPKNTPEVNYGDMKFTTDLTIFKHIGENRQSYVPTYRKRVKRVKESITKNGYKQLSAIVVDPNHRIVDGQARVTAIKELQKEGWKPENGELGIHYFVGPERSVDEIREMNGYNTKWTGDDIASSMVQSGNYNYQIYLDFRREFNFPMDVTVSLLENRMSDGRIMEKFRAGNLEIKDKNKARNLAQKFLELESLETDFNKGAVRSRYFLRALVKLITREDFNYDFFHNKVTKTPSNLQKQKDTRGCIQMIQNIYNYHTPHKKKVMFMEPR